MGGTVIFSIKRKQGKIRCPVCRSRDIIFRGTLSMRFRTVPIGSKRAFLDFEVQRLECRRCGKIRQEKLGFADPRFSYSHAKGVTPLIPSEKSSDVPGQE